MKKTFKPIPMSIDEYTTINRVVKLMEAVIVEPIVGTNGTYLALKAKFTSRLDNDNLAKIQSFYGKFFEGKLSIKCKNRTYFIERIA